MPDLKILLSELKIQISYKHNYMTQFCKDYVARFDKADITAIACDDAVLKEQELVPTAPIEACESLCIYREIAEQLPSYDRVVFHGAAIQYSGEAYLFTAPSGTGKTTHINLWRKYLGNNVSMINGDKPIINVTDKPIVYGTPWAGKEGYQRNVSAPVKAICILKQGKTNMITRLENSAAINHIMRQVYMPKNPVALSKTLALIGQLIENVPVYMLECDISEQAFKTSFDKMTK